MQLGNTSKAESFRKAESRKQKAEIYKRKHRNTKHGVSAYRYRPSSATAQTSPDAA